MEKKDIKNNYEQLRKKYPLPDFESINNEFEISSIENKEFLLSEIRRKITERLEVYAKILESLLQPDTASLSAMHECKFIEDKEKEDIYNIYKKLMIIDRDSVIASLGGEKENADFIKELLEDWLKLKEDIKPIIEKIRSTWKKETDIKEELGYLG